MNQQKNGDSKPQENIIFNIHIDVAAHNVLQFLSIYRDFQHL